MTFDRICVGSYIEKQDIFLMYTFLNIMLYMYCYLEEVYAILKQNTIRWSSHFKFVLKY
jgi:hypothetical protein